MPNENETPSASSSTSGENARYSEPALTLAELDQVCAIARKHGIVRLTYRGADLSLMPEMLPMQADQRPPPKTPMTHPDEPEMWDAE